MLPSIDPTLEQKRDLYEYLDTTLNGKSAFFKAPLKHQTALPPHPAKLLAYYLPQFHPIPINNEQWGKGFTEWSQITRTLPQFYGHYQPHLPADLGFYDLRLIDTLQAQATLARQYGIHGFCFYHYWFSGRKILDTPIEILRKNKEIDIGYCICWANEPWSRTWDATKDTIIPQTHGFEHDKYFIFDILDHLRDTRYVRYENKPLLIIYNPQIIHDIQRTVAYWREVCLAEGIGEILIYCSNTTEITHPSIYGLDGVVEFPPHGHWLGAAQNVDGNDPNFFNKNSHMSFCNAVDAANFFYEKKLPDFPFFRGVFTAWDNTARKGNNACVYINSSPPLYQEWLKLTIQQSLRRNPAETLVFINAWNEWAEGAHLEPDRWYGHAYLHATLEALNQTNFMDENTP